MKKIDSETFTRTMEQRAPSNMAKAFRLVAIAKAAQAMEDQHVINSKIREIQARYGTIKFLARVEIIGARRRSIPDARSASGRGAH